MKNVIVSVSLTGIGVTLGYVTVDGLWRQLTGPAARWRILPGALAAAWKTRAAAVTLWVEKR